MTPESPPSHLPLMSILRRLNLRRRIATVATAVRHDANLWTPAPLSRVDRAAESLFHVSVDLSDAPDVTSSYTRPGSTSSCASPNSQGCLPFVFLKPTLAAVTLILYAKGKYVDGSFSPNQSYMYLTLIYTVSYPMALYALVLFYVACRDLLQPFNPVPKFIMIKSVVFLTYWQGVLVFLAAKTELIKNAEDAAQYQNFIICVEMLLAAAGHLYAFPYKEYSCANIGASGDFRASLAHALKLNDLYHDTVHQCGPTNHDYVLYNSAEGDEGKRKYRSSTFVPTGPEMDVVRRNRNIFGNKVDDIQLSSLSSSSASTPTGSGVMHVPPPNSDVACGLSG